MFFIDLSFILKIFIYIYKTISFLNYISLNYNKVLQFLEYQKPYLKYLKINLFFYHHLHIK